MAKEGLTYDNMKSSLVISGKPWSLCIGAGCSWPIFPSWYDLATNLAKRLDGSSDSVCSLLRQIFSPDVIIQSVYEKSKMSPEEFAVILGEELYNFFF